MRLDRDLAAVPLDDDATGDVEPEAGALADVLGREERLERVRLDLGGHARRRCRAISTTTRSAVGARSATRSVPAPSIASIALSMRFVQTWLSSPGHRLDRRHVVAVVAHDRDAVGELVAEHHQRALDPLA